MAKTETVLADVPDHVPEHLVYEWEEEDIPKFEWEPYEVWKQLAKENRPIFYTPHYHNTVNRGSWVVTTTEYCREVLQNPDPFSNAIQFGGDNASWPRRIIPLGMDPPDHMKHRVLIAKTFSPKAIDSMEANVYKVCNDQIDKVAKQGHTEFMSEFARVFPGIIFMTIMGMPLERKEEFFNWEEKFFHDGTPEEKQQVGIAIAQFLQDLITEKRRNPGDDLTSHLIASEVDGKQLDDETIEDFLFLMYIAGLDTVNGGMGHVFRYLATNPKDQQMLRENPIMIPDALEELMRVHSWIGTSRVLSRDHVFHGVQMKKGERINVFNNVASWDENLVEDPFKVDLTRDVNPHLAFGGGPHRCAGSHLARRELRIAMAEWLRRIPQFEITPGEKTPYFTDGLLSLRKLPLSWDGSKAI